jgi:RNA polymerase sigma-70 factor (ECF subfamily)
VKKRQFVKFYDQYAPRIYRFVYLKVNSPQDSEDLTSEVFFRFWQNISTNSEQQARNNKIDNPQALLYRIANNLVIDFYRKKSRTELILDPEEDNVLAKIPDKTDLNKKMSLDSDITEVKKALNQLKGEYQNIIIWRYLDDFSVKEIAQIMEKPEGTIRVLIHRALVCLKKEFRGTPSKLHP